MKEQNNFLTMVTNLGLIVLRGFVLSRLWLWFVVPSFGIAAISIATGIGFSFIAVLLTNHLTVGLKASDNPILKSALMSMAATIVIFFCGYIVHLF